MTGYKAISDMKDTFGRDEIKKGHWQESLAISERVDACPSTQVICTYSCSGLDSRDPSHPLACHQGNRIYEWDVLMLERGWGVAISKYVHQHPLYMVLLRGASTFHSKISIRPIIMTNGTSELNFVVSVLLCGWKGWMWYSSSRYLSARDVTGLLLLLWFVRSKGSGPHYYYYYVSLTTNE